MLSISHLEDNKTVFFKTAQTLFQLKKTIIDECEQNRFLIFNEFANCGEIFKAWNDSGVNVSRFTSLYQLE